MKKKKDNKTPFVILVLVYGCLLYAIYVSLITLALGFWGQTTMGTVDRYGVRVNDIHAEPNRSNTVSKGYYFMVNGKEYRGYVMYASDERWPSLKDGETRSERIRYFSFLPYINRPSALVEFSRMGVGGIIYHIFTPIACVLLLLFFTGTLKREKKSKKGRRKFRSSKHQ